MLLGFSYLYVCYFLFLFFQKSETDRLKKAIWPKKFIPLKLKLKLKFIKVHLR